MGKILRVEDKYAPHVRKMMKTSDEVRVVKAAEDYTEEMLDAVENLAGQDRARAAVQELFEHSYQKLSNDLGSTVEKSVKDHVLRNLDPDDPDALVFECLAQVFEGTFAEDSDHNFFVAYVRDYTIESSYLGKVQQPVFLVLKAGISDVINYTG